MFEKLKDFLYDMSDIFVSLLIIAVIFLAVSWKISDTLKVDIDEEQAVKTTNATDSSSIVVTPVESTEATSEGVTETNSDATTTEAATQAPTQAATQPTTQAPTQPTTQPATQPTTQAAVLEKFVVSEGELGNTIGKNLQSQGFISSSNAFVKRLIEMGYDSKLKAGTFKISKTYDLDTIIKILAGER